MLGDGNIFHRLPDDWKTDVVVVRGGGLDDDGEPLPPSDFPMFGCLLAPESREDPLDRSQIVTGNAVLYTPTSAPEVLSSDRIRTPTTSAMPGEWAVDGAPIRWPFGFQIRLSKGGGFSR